MANQTKPPVTQRAYTLRLRGVDPNDQSWREALWMTHKAVNDGAKVFGDWLLTLRGGLDHALVDTVGKSSDGKLRDFNKEEIKARRILLALSWLSVESERGAPGKYIVARGTDPGHIRHENVKKAFEIILEKRGLTDEEIREWKQDCISSLTASIRSDAVWVNRSEAFDAILREEDIQKGRKDAKIVLWHLLTDNYLNQPKNPQKKKKESSDQEDSLDQVELSDQGNSRSDGNTESKDSTGKGAGQKTRHLYSYILGTGISSGFGTKKDTLWLKDFWKSHLEESAYKATGIPTEPTQKKPSPNEINREMLSKAASRIAQIWTKQKQQEQEREQRKTVITKLNELRQTHRKAVDLLDIYCQKRGQAMGSLEEYLIMPRAIDGWDRVIDAWEKYESNLNRENREKGATETLLKEVDAEKAKIVAIRISEAKRLQDEDHDKKFGDINLFISLAETKYEPVWRDNASILQTYVNGRKAEADAKRLKVASYRHPDPFINPVFCQFGASRPSIEYNRLKKNHVGDAREITMLVWTGTEAKKIKLLAVSNRFDKEIGKSGELRGDMQCSALEVPSFSRLGIGTVAKVGESQTYSVAYIFDDREVKKRKPKDNKALAEELSNNNGKVDKKIGKMKEPSWNGMLLTDRRSLRDIGRLELTNPGKARKVEKQLQWWLTISIELLQKGPWYNYIWNSSDQNPFKQTYKSGSKAGQEYLNAESWPYDEVNKTRNGQARLILSRLPNLRVLSVDLGHRQAAACVVWEVLDVDTVKKACRDAGHIEPKEKDLFLHLKTKEKKIKKGQEVVVDKTTIYRRIGSDVLPDGTPHPGSWARLDRQFFIKLQGEEAVRMASNEEIWMVHKLESDLGRSMPLVDRLVRSGWGKASAQRQRLDAFRKKGWKPVSEIKPSDDVNSGKVVVADSLTEEEIDIRKPPLSVDDLIASAIRSMRLALKRQGDRARIAFTMHKNYKPMPGDRKYYFDEARDASIDDDSITRENKHIEYIQEALNLWHNLFSSRTWKDEQAKKLWEDYIEAKVGDYEDLEKLDENFSDSDRKEKLKANQEKLRKIAEQVKNFRNELYALWEKEWNEKNQNWKRQLRWFKDWLQPRKGLDNKIDPAIRGMGGLSLTRIASLIEFRRKVQIGFFNRLHPDGTHSEIKEQFGQKTLNALENLREQRVKQLASRIVEAALGLGRMQKDERKDRKRPTVQVDRPCHAIVIENLKNYRPDQTRTRRENRQLMAWSSSKILKYLTELCQLYGLHFREVSAAYTSRQDSRTGAPGIRWPIKEFMRSPFWRKQVAPANKNKNERERYIQNLDIKWKEKLEEDWNTAGVARIPLSGGEMFVSADFNSPAAKGLQADLNAAANIGLRALTDPDWPGKWWYMPIDSKKMQPIVDKVKGSAAMEKNGQIIELGIDAIATEEIKSKKKDRKKSSDVINLWCDISSTPLDGRDKGAWKTFTDYQEDVENRVISILIAHDKK